mgnify:CR=1 FL=1
MKNCDVSVSVKIAACICGRDGLISQAEEQKMFQLISNKFPTFSPDDFDTAINEFFDSNDQIEDYLSKVSDQEMRKFTLDLSKASASVDGLDIRENIALQKAYQIWGESCYE